jgi:ABC-type lipoprotein export system ATPase subunit
LKSTNLAISKIGLVYISGPSGSGKTTLANIISLLEHDYNGRFYINKKNISSLKKEKLNEFRLDNIGVIFQQYNLLEDETAIYNVALPLIIKGKKKNDAFNVAKSMFKKIAFSPRLYNEEVKNLSGGEKQRIAILRTLVSEPSIIIADEPTSALDGISSKLVLDLLKEISLESLVIVISHSEELLIPYADRIIRLEKGEVKQDILVNEGTRYIQTVAHRTKKSLVCHWTRHHSKKVVANSCIKTIFFCFIFFMCFTLSSISFSLIDNLEEIKINEPRRSLDYTNFEISKKSTIPIEGSDFSLIKTERLTELEVEELTYNFPTFDFNISFDALFINEDFLYMNDISLGNKIIFKALRSFEENDINQNLISERSDFRSDNEIIINNILFDELSDEIKENIFTEEFTIKFSRNISCYTNDFLNPLIVDDFNFEHKYRVSMIADEQTLFNEPTVYYSYQKMEETLRYYHLSNISNFFKSDLNIIEYIKSSSNSEEITSFAHQVFFLDDDIVGFENNIEEIKNKGELEIMSTSLSRKEVFLSTVDVTTTSIEFILSFVIFGSLVTIGIITFSFYVLNKKKIAILLYLGANKYHILKIFFSVTSSMILIGLLGTVMTNKLIIDVLNSTLGNALPISGNLFKQIDFYNILDMPKICFLFAAIFIFSFLISLCTLLFRRISLIKELKNDD